MTATKWIAACTAAAFLALSPLTAFGAATLAGGKNTRHKGGANKMMMMKKKKTMMKKKPMMMKKHAM